MGKVNIANGAVVGASRETVAVLTPASTVNIDASVANVFTLTPGQAETLNVTGGLSGERLTLVVTTSGTSSYTLTFGTGFSSTATLATGTSDAKVFTVSFLHDGTAFREVARTAAQ